MTPKLWLTGLCALMLAGCSLPRGAGLQSEVLREADAENPGFEVYPVTRNFLPEVASWPESGGVTRYDWISKQNAPIGRVILPGDSVTISIWDSDENSLLTSIDQRVAQLQEMRVSPNGSLFVPYIGSVTVGGMTEAQARAEVQEAIITVSPSAQIQLRATAGPRHSVSLVSGVNRPGAYPLEERDMTVLSALSLGGGAREEFENPQLRLLRGQKAYAISLDELFRKPTLDTVLRTGDKILVTEDESYFLSLGASGREELITFPKEHVSALDAMSLIGGLSDGRANPQGILVLRDYGGPVRNGPAQERVVFTLDLTSADGLFSAGQFRINPKDLVYVTESPVTNARTILSLIGASFGVARQLDN